LGRLDAVLADATEAESAPRGYIITGDEEAYPEPFRKAVEGAKPEEHMYGG
jgi:CHASE3 domain sensor protein